jgi:ABC-type nitrate/sulfonate/bicarbonate transport system substrate-binding protein
VVGRSSRRRRRNRYFRAAVACLVAITAIAVAYVLIADDTSPPTRSRASATIATPIYLDGPFGPRFAGEMLASARGDLSGKAPSGGGPSIALHPVPDDAKLLETVAREHAIGVTTGQKFLLAVWRGVPVVAFGASFLDTSTAIFALERSGLRRPADLVGKRVGLRRGSEGEVVLDAMLAQLGLPRSQIRKIEGQDSFSALQAGDVDAVIATVGEQPSQSDFPPLNVIRPPAYAIHIPGLVYFASTDLVRDNPEVIRQVLEGFIRGWRDVYADYGRSVPRLVGFDPARLTPERVRFALEQQRDIVRPTGARIADYDESRWRTLRDVLLFAKLGEDSVGLSEAVNYQFLRDVYRRAPDAGAPGAWASDN